MAAVAVAVAAAVAVAVAVAVAATSRKYGSLNETDLFWKIRPYSGRAQSTLTDRLTRKDLGGGKGLRLVEDPVVSVPASMHRLWSPSDPAGVWPISLFSAASRWLAVSFKGSGGDRRIVVWCLY